MALRDTVVLRRRWRNDTGNQRAYPLRQLTPQSLAELQQAVRDAEADGCPIRAVGSGHSWSDVALTDGILVRPDGLRRPLQPDLLRPDLDPEQETLVRVEAGMRIAELNSFLQDRRPQKLALPNMGGFDGQTVAGVISTSTHGSGIRFGPLNDLVRSLDVVAVAGAVHRIERADGPTDAAAFQADHPDWVLRQDDAFFDAAVVGMGCMGLIYAVTLAVRPFFYLREVRTLSTWSRVRERLADDLAANDHYELLFNPYPRAGRDTDGRAGRSTEGETGRDTGGQAGRDPEGEIECLVTTRNEVAPDEYRHDRRRSRSLLMELAARFPLTPVLIDFAVRLWPQISPWMIAQALKALVNDDYVNVSYRVLNIGAANYLPAYSCEIGVPVDDRGLHLAAVERIVEVARERRRVGEVFHSSPISLRFVKASDACMSMMQGRDTMMIELIMAAHTVGGVELLAAHERALHQLEGRPHWGQLNTLTGELVRTLYPRLADWRRVHEQLGSSGVFDSPFSRRIGL